MFWAFVPTNPKSNPDGVYSARSICLSTTTLSCTYNFFLSFWLMWTTSFPVTETMPEVPDETFAPRRTYFASASSSAISLSASCSASFLISSWRIFSFIRFFSASLLKTIFSASYFFFLSASLAFSFAALILALIFYFSIYFSFSSFYL